MQSPGILQNNPHAQKYVWLEALRLHHWQHHAKAKAIEDPEGTDHSHGLAARQNAAGDGPSNNSAANDLMLWSRYCAAAIKNKFFITVVVVG